MTEYEEDGMLDEEEFCRLEEVLLDAAEIIAQRFFILSIIAVFIGFSA